MDTKHNIAFYVLFFLILGILIFNIFCGKSPNDSLDKALRELDSAQKHLDSALVKIDSTRIIVDSMRSDFNAFQGTISDMRDVVDGISTNSKKSLTLFRTSMASLQQSNKQLKDQLKLHTDSLPEIFIIK